MRVVSALTARSKPQRQYRATCMIVTRHLQAMSARAPRTTTGSAAADTGFVFELACKTAPPETACPAAAGTSVPWVLDAVKAGYGMAIANVLGESRTLDRSMELTTRSGDTLMLREEDAVQLPEKSPTVHGE